MHLLTIGPPSLIIQLLLGRRGSVDYELTNYALVRYHGQLLIHEANRLLIEERGGKREATPQELC